MMMEIVILKFIILVATALMTIVCAAVVTSPVWLLSGLCDDFIEKLIHQPIRIGNTCLRCAYVQLSSDSNVGVCRHCGRYGKRYQAKVYTDLGMYYDWRWQSLPEFATSTVTQTASRIHATREYEESRAQTLQERAERQARMLELTTVIQDATGILQPVQYPSLDALHADWERIMYDPLVEKGDQDRWIIETFIPESRRLQEMH